jgi:stalled ribosome rescue protein Dom34
MMIPHAVVWLDHHEAKVLFLHEDDARFEERHLKAGHSHGHNHHRKDEHHHGPDRHFFEEIVQALEPAQAVLVAGPGQAKNEFKKFVDDHGKALKGRIVGVESLDHPTEGQIAALGRKIFKKTDAMRGDPLLR